MKKRIILQMSIFMLLITSVSAVLADSGNFGPGNSLRYKDEVYLSPWKTVRIEAWDPHARNSIWRQTEACLGATAGASSEYCHVGSWQVGKTPAVAQRSRLLGGTAYTYANWGYE